MIEVRIWKNYFTPHSHEGATEDLNNEQHSILISIHTPTRERRFICRTGRDCIYFNPHSHEGATIVTETASKTTQFQSTLPRGSDDIRPVKTLSYNNFNPHSHEGATLQPSIQDRCYSISIHTPTRERQKLYQRKNIGKKFQSTLPRGSDCKIAQKQF